MVILTILIFGAGTFLIGWGLGRWAQEPLIDDLERDLAGHHTDREGFDLYQKQ